MTCGQRKCFGSLREHATSLPKLRAIRVEPAAPVVSMASGVENHG